MAVYKNVASQKIAVYAHDTSADAAKTGDAANITAQISKDGGATAATNDTNPTELDSTDAPGIYIFDMTQAETNADLIVLAATSSTSDISIETAIIYTTPGDSTALDANVKEVSDDSTAADNLELACDNYSATRGLTGTALPAAAADAAGGLPISDAGGLDIDTYMGRITADVATEAKQDTAQSDLDTLTGVDGATLATLQGNYAPAKAGDNMNLADDAITSAKFDETTAYPVKSADTGATQIARTGADGDTLETLSDQIDAVPTAAEIDTQLTSSHGAGSWSSSAASGTYTMDIVTQTSGGVRIPWVTVAIVNGSGTVIAAFTTDSNGDYEQELDAGTFTFKPYKPEYSFTNSVETISAAGTVTLTGSAVSQSVAQFTPQDVLELVRHQVYESSAGFWSDAEVYLYMWQAETEIAQLVECTEYEDDATTTVASTQEYQKPTDCLYLKRVMWNNVPLKCVDFRGKDFHEHNAYGGSDSEGQPHSYYEWGDNVGLYPIPEEAQTLKYYYIRQPAKLSASTTYFTVPVLFHNAIIEYCLSRMYAKDQDEQRSSLHWQLWMQGVNNAKEKWSARNKSNRFHVVKNSDNFPQTEQGLI